MTARTLVLPSTDFGASTRTRDIALIVSASLAVALAAQVRIPLPFTPVPVTAQTFAVGIIGLLLGARRGAAAILLYLAEGAAGLPFFSGGDAGLVALTGATAGYLFAMPVAAWLMGFFAERAWDRSPVRTFLAMNAGSLLVMASGTLWLALLTGSLARAATLGFLPFVPGDLCKAALAAALFPTLWAVKSRLG